MEDIVKRLNYYTGQFLREQDFTEEQEYHIDRMRRHNVQLHTPGIAAGLAVTATVGAISAVVAPGTALDKEGRQIVLKDPFNVAFESSHNGQWVLVVISYREEEADAATVGDAGMTRMLERPEVGVVLESGAPDWDLRIRLARLRIAANGTIAEHDTSVRTPVGARVRPDETFERLRLSRQGGNPNQFPVLSSGAANRADLAGDLSVTGNILVTGTVDGRDISADAATNEAHRNNTNNPHSVTALQTGAITGVAGVLNPGGQVSLVAGNNIAITPDNGTGKKITIASATIDGVSNPGGNIDLFPGGAITIAPDNGTAKRITISETHSALTGNPHGTLASQLGEYDFKHTYINSMYFLETWGDGATRTFDVGFEPKVIHVNGVAQANLGGAWHGGTINGIARVTGASIHQHGCGPYVVRQSAAPGVITTGLVSYGVVTFCHFSSSLVSPSISAGVTVKVSSTTSTSITFMLNRPATVPLFDLWVYFTCFGY